MRKSQKIYLPFKRLIGIIGSFVGIFVCFALLWWWVTIINFFVTKGHPFFVHKRYGKNKKVFGCLKFRSMKVDANPYAIQSNVDKTYQHNMETCFGRFLRKSSIDETLQLFNIFIGDMAFIGPRPGAAFNEEELVKDREKYNPSAFAVRPGLGGYAQYSLKRDHNPEDKARLDHEYVCKMSFLFDMKLFLCTILSLFRKRK